MKPSAESFDRLYGIVKRLRADDGCPWDREQTPESLRANLIEEAYECVEAIDQKDGAHVREELGDVFLLATMIAYMYEQKGDFSVSDSLEDVSDKLVRRHPHVFGDAVAKDAGEVLTQWNKIKVEKEGRRAKDSILDEVSRALPPLERAYRIQKKASKVGFDWPDLAGVWAKIDEEIAEVKAALADHERERTDAAREELEGEIGDLLYAVTNISRFLHIDPAVALHRTNVKFAERFKHVEKRMKETGQTMETGKLDAMDVFWEEAKVLLG